MAMCSAKYVRKYQNPLVSLEIRGFL